MGRPRKYTPDSLRRAVNRYFDSISRRAVVTEKVPTGEYDSRGHIIFEEKPVTNSLGKEVTALQYILPPTVGGLCAFLGIHRDTWNEWSDPAKYPEFSDTVTCARGRMHAYLEEQSLTRAGKDLKGVLFNLENNYGYKERLEVVAGKLEDLLE